MDTADQGGSNVNPLALIFLLVMCFLMLGSSRRKAVSALLITAGFIPLGQQIVVFGLHFYFMRILILAGMVRLLTRQEFLGFQLNSADKLFFGWVMVEFVCALFRGASAETFGAVYDTVGIYLLVRILTRDATDVLVYLSVLAGIGIAMGGCMACEAITHRNPFHIFGGVPAITVQRGDRFRCQGPFRHPILAGTFGATLFPLMIGLWFEGGRGKKLAFAGAISGAVITVCSASSGPLLTFVVALAGCALWPMRTRMRIFRYGSVAAILGLALVMNAPVWFVIGKISDLTGGGGYYRSYLIDQFIRHFDQWWLIGTSYTANWAIAGIVLPNNPNMVDITNHYVAQGVGGGVLGLGLFLALIVGYFKIIGRSVRANAAPPVSRKLLWAFGVCLAGHCAAFISVSYFDQINIFWFWTLAIIAGIPLWAPQIIQTKSVTVAENSALEAPAPG